MKQLKLKNYFLTGNDLTKAILNTKDEKEKEQLELAHIEPLQLWLVKQRLHGSASRARTRFIKLIAERADEIDKERMRLAEDNCKLKKGELVYLDKEGKETMDKNKGTSYAMDEKQKNKFDVDFNSYLKEELELDITPERNDTIYGVRDLIMDTTEEFEGMMAMRYAEICDCFDAIK